MPREVVNPLHIPTSIAPDGEGSDAVIRQFPTVQVGWQRELGEIQLGLETPFEQAGQHHLVDHLYADSAGKIGDLLIEKLLASGWKIEYDPGAVRGDSLPASSETLGRMILDAVTGADGEGNPGPYGWTGWYTHLDRHGAARLIRVLQKAAAGTFGKDPW